MFGVIAFAKGNVAHARIGPIGEFNFGRDDHFMTEHVFVAVDIFQKDRCACDGDGDAQFLAKLPAGRVLPALAKFDVAAERADPLSVPASSRTSLASKRPSRQ